ncbi:hypothetical protein Patl1_26167 [Pistacia atlantica]|uniref:Uncharacterized protein n=1 Tax=Pistacia atlantica TaxID=434234 RepID=A0ACC1B4W1_9ROSI|nr:hypothetical protein Patl1_26167 [Pistacia atlantica]
MNSSNSNNGMISSATKQPPQLNLQQAFNTFQTQCSAFFHHLSHHPLFKPDTFSLPDPAKRALEVGFSRFNSFSLPSNKNPVWASITRIQSGGGTMSTEAIEERLAGIPVYALSNFNEEFVLVSGASNGKSLGLMCFKKEDAEALLEQMKSMDPVMRKEGSKVVPVALNKVCQLKVDGVAFRLIPESNQIKNALKEREKAGFSEDGFSGVPVFQVLS